MTVLFSLAERVGADQGVGGGVCIAAAALRGMGFRDPANGAMKRL
jgi:hypothetical protein